MPGIDEAVTETRAALALGVLATRFALADWPAFTAWCDAHSTIPLRAPKGQAEELLDQLDQLAAALDVAWGLR